jgi:hypothetical protein
MANLLMALHRAGHTMFTTAAAAQITRLTFLLTSSLLHKARKRGLVSQLKRDPKRRPVFCAADRSFLFRAIFVPVT